MNERKGLCLTLPAVIMEMSIGFSVIKLIAPAYLHKFTTGVDLRSSIFI